MQRNPRRRKEGRQAPTTGTKQGYRGSTSFSKKNLENKLVARTFEGFRQHLALLGGFSKRICQWLNRQP